MSDTRYCVWDTETTMKGAKDDESNGLNPRNDIIVSGLKCGDYEKPVLLYTPDGTRDPGLPYSQFDVLVGQNLKFDLKYIWQREDLQDWIAGGGRVFDTMIAEYLLSGQQTKYASLDYLSEKYGGTLKDDQVSTLYKAGIGAEGIDPDILLPYAEHDILNTEMVYLAQSKALERVGLMPLFRGHMDHYLALIEMEFNGLYIDREKAEEMYAEKENQLIALRLKLQGLTWPMFVEINILSAKEIVFNPESQDHISAVLFNTPLTCMVNGLIPDKQGGFKTFGEKHPRAGEYKTRLTKRARPLYKEAYPEGAAEAGYGIDKKFSRRHKSKEVYSSDEDVLIKIKKSGQYPAAQDFIVTLLEYRRLQKQVSTYLYTEGGKGLIPKIYPIDGCVHHTLDCVKTVTGRLNARNPNMQNVPKEMRSMFTSRFGKEKGKMCEMDFGQLEVVVQAYLTQSEKMIQHIKEGMDFHVKRLAYAEGISYEECYKLVKESPTIWGEKRRAAKVVSFQKAYGAGSEQLAEAAGLPIHIVEKIMQAEDAEYQEIGAFNEMVQHQLRATRTPTNKPAKIKEKGTDPPQYHYGWLNGNLYVVGQGTYQSITGRKFVFNEYHTTSEKLRATHRDVFAYFMPTEIANYPVQGTGADIVALSVGRVYRYLLVNDWRNHIKMVNEVHDSLVLDIKDCEEHRGELALIETILSDVAGTLKGCLGLDFNVPLGIDTKIGESWEGSIE